MAFLGMNTWFQNPQAKRSMNSLNDLAGQQKGLYEQYMPQAMEGIQGMYTPGSPLFQQLDQQAQAGGQMLQHQLDQRGLGQSSFAGNGLSGYYAGLQNQKAQMALQGLNMLAGLASGQGGQAQQGFGNVAQLGNEQGGGLTGIGNFLGSSLNMDPTNGVVPWAKKRLGL